MKNVTVLFFFEFGCVIIVQIKNERMKNVKKWKKVGAMDEKNKNPIETTLNSQSYSNLYAFFSPSTSLRMYDL